MADMSRIADEWKQNEEMTKKLNKTQEQKSSPPKLSKKHWYVTKEAEKRIEQGKDDYRF